MRCRHIRHLPHFYESLAVDYYYLQANTTDATTMKKHITGLFQFQPNLVDDGRGEYGTIDESSIPFVAVAPGMSTEAANINTQPSTDYASGLQSQGVSSTVQISPIPSWYEWYRLLFDAPAQNGENAMMTSRLFSRDTLPINLGRCRDSCRLSQILPVGLHSLTP